MNDTIVINGVEYIPASTMPPAPPTGNRAVVVIDRGWIIAGDVTETGTGSERRITLNRAVHVFRWESIAFDGMLRDPKSSKVTLKPLAYPVDLPAQAEIFRVPVDQEWGL